MAINKERARCLWVAIVSAVDAAESLGGEGNSGEFTSAKEVRSVKNGMSLATLQLIEEFTNATGWEPLPETKNGMDDRGCIYPNINWGLEKV